MNRNLPPLPKGMKEWFAIHEMIEQHGTKSFTKWLKEVREATVELQRAIAVHGKVADIERLHDEAAKMADGGRRSHRWFIGE